jgi:hypothetical protein
MIVATSSRQSNNPRRIPSGLLLAILFVMPMMLFGQGYFGTLSGNITDPSGALVPGAKVTLVDQQKGYQFATTSDNSGRYVFTTIPPGLYTVSAELEGFEKTVRTNVTLNVSENATANLGLKVAISKQSVDVDSQAQSLQTEDAVTTRTLSATPVRTFRPMAAGGQTQTF